MKIERSFRTTHKMANAAKRLFICLDNAGYEVSLERRKNLGGTARRESGAHWLSQGHR